MQGKIRLFFILLVLGCSIAGPAMADDNAPVLVSTPFPNLEWYYHNPGDYNQDGLVSPSDLTALGKHLRAQGAFSPDSALSVVDGDGNGEVNLADLTTIAQNLGHSVLGGYEVGWGSTVLGKVTFSSAQADLGQRKRFQFTIPNSTPEGLSYLYSAYPLNSEGGRVSGVSHTLIHLPSPPLAAPALIDPSWTYDPGSGTTEAHWYYLNLADGDQSGSVDMADLTSIGTHFGEVSQGGLGGAWATTDARLLIDSDINGEINLSDLAKLMQNIGRRVDGYHVYVSESATDYPTEPWEVSTISSIGTLPYSATALLNPAERMNFDFTIPAGTPTRFWWVRPYAPGGWEGAPSPPQPVQ